MIIVHTTAVKIAYVYIIIRVEEQNGIMHEVYCTLVYEILLSCILYFL